MGRASHEKEVFALLMVLSALLCLSMPAYAVELPVKAKAALLMEKGDRPGAFCPK